MINHTYRFCIIFLCGIIFLVSCGSNPKAEGLKILDDAFPKVEGLKTLDNALIDVVMDLGSHVQEKTEIVIAAIDTPLLGVSEFLSDELASVLVSSGRFIILERGPALEALTAEHGVQMSGLVSDASAVGIGHYLGAKVVLTGTFSRFDGFNQLRVRAIDVRTSQILTLSTLRIIPNDAVLANIFSPQERNAKPSTGNNNAIAHLDKGVDLFNEGMFLEAVEEFNKSIEIDNNIPEVYYHRANTLMEHYFEKCYRGGDYDWSEFNKLARLLNIDMNEGQEFFNEKFAEILIEDFNTAIKLKPDYIDALFNRGITYYSLTENRVNFLEDMSAVLELKPDFIDALYVRGRYYYYWTNFIEKAIDDFTSILRIKPYDFTMLWSRGNIYSANKDFTRAIADYEAALRIKSDPNDKEVIYVNEQLNKAQQAQRTSQQ